MGATSQAAAVAKQENPLSATSKQNPNTIFPCLRDTGHILKQRIRIGQDICKSHFVFKKVIGKGQFGFIWLALKLPEDLLMVVKVMDKAIIFNKRCVDTVMNELKLMTELMHPFISNLKYAFQEERTLYLVTEYYSGGDLAYYLYKQKKWFTEKQSTFIIASVLLALEFLHDNGVLHRDVRPQNICFDEKGNIHLIDLGLARVWQPQNASDTSGTPGYAAPEIMFRQNHDVSSDFFGLGVILHELMLMRKPYPGHDRFSYMEQLKKYQMILKKADGPELWQLEAIDFINKCISRKPESRLGINGTPEVKSHVWLKDFEFKKLLKHEMPPPFVPNSRDHFNSKDFFPSPDEIRMNTPLQQKLNEQLIKQDEFQQLFNGYYFNIDKEIANERALKAQDWQMKS